MTYQQYTKAGHITAIILGALALYAWLSVLSGGYDDEVKAHEEACHMHHVWLEGAYARVPEDERNGRPITVGEFERKCGGVE